MAEGFLDYFLPSAERARECRAAMDASLLASAKALLDQLLAEPRSVRPVPSYGPVGTLGSRALEYGAYFDLLLDPPSGDTVSESARLAAQDHLTRRIAEIEAVGTLPSAASPVQELPNITILSETDHSPDEIARFVRWWDIEPDNAMALTGVSDAQLAAARRLIALAYERLSQAVPEMREETAEIVKEIVVSRQGDARLHEFAGATSFALWGAILVNCEAHAGWPQYFKTIVHEAAHNLLFALARSEPLVSDDPHELRHSPLRRQDRPMDGIYHAAFVSARESLALDRLLSWDEQAGELSEEEAETLEDFLESSVIAFWDCAETVRGEGHLTPLGETILSECEAFMAANFALQPG